MIQPKIDSAKALQYLKYAKRVHKKTDDVTAVYVIGVRGYYLDSVGEVGKNDRGKYDDAIVICSPSGVMAFNGNTDPSAWRKGIATLRAGFHRYKRGNHGLSKPGGGYPAFRPATRNEELPVDRDGETNPKPGVAINIHRGGLNTTSSLGCQTIHPSQWDAFYALQDSLMSRYGVKEFDYVLVVETEFRKAGGK